MMRWTLTVLTVLLLAVWLASGWGGLGWRFLDSSSGVRHTVAVGLGTVYFARIGSWAENIGRWTSGSDLGFRTFGADGFGEAELTNYKIRPWLDWGRRRNADSFISVPLWPVALAMAVPTVSLWRRHLRKRRRARIGHCATCGYDLTGIAGVCPECGQAPDSRPPTLVAPLNGTGSGRPLDA